MVFFDRPYFHRERERAIWTDVTCTNRSIRTNISSTDGFTWTNVVRLLLVLTILFERALLPLVASFEQTVLLVEMGYLHEH